VGELSSGPGESMVGVMKCPPASATDHASSPLIKVRARNFVWLFTHVQYGGSTLFEPIRNRKLTWPLAVSLKTLC